MKGHIKAGVGIRPWQSQVTFTPKSLKNKNNNCDMETGPEEEKKANLNPGELNTRLSYFWVYIKFGKVQLHQFYMKIFVESCSSRRYWTIIMGHLLKHPRAFPCILPSSTVESRL